MWAHIALLDVWETVVGNCHSPLDLAELLGEGDRCRGSGSGGP